MLRTNLSTRPFYNERAVHWGLGLALVAILALTAFNVTRVLALSQQQSALAAAADRDEERARALTGDAGALRASIDQAALEHVIHAAQEANEIIDARTFSWTELLNHIERTLPTGVMLTAVTPRVDRGRFHIQMNVIGKAVEGIDDFIDKLEATHAFSGMSPTTEHITEQGYYEVMIVGDYDPSAAVAQNDKEDKDEEKAPAEKPVTPAKPATAAATNPTTPPQPSSTSAATRSAKPATAPRGVS